MNHRGLVFVAACLGMAFFGIAFIVMGTVLPQLTLKYTLDAVQASSLVTFLPVGVLLGSLLLGPVVNFFGYRISLIISTLIVVAGLEGLALFDRLIMLRISIFLIGFGGGVLNGETNALVSCIYDDRERGARLSLLGVFYGVGAIVVPLIISFLSKIYSYENILMGAGIVMSLCVFYFFGIRFPETASAHKFSLRKSVELLKEPLLLLFSLLLFFQSGLEGLCNNWTTLYLGETTNIPANKIVLTLTFFIVGMVLVRLIMGKILRYYKETSVLFGGISIAIAGCVVLFLSESFGMAATGLFLAGAGLAGGFPLVFSLIGRQYKALGATAFGIALFIALTGNIALNYLMGYVAKYVTIVSFPLFLTISLVLQAGILYKIIRTNQL